MLTNALSFSLALYEQKSKTHGFSHVIIYLLIFAVLDWLLGAFLLVHCFAILFGCALALFGVLRLTLLLGYLVTLLVLNSFASFVWDFCAFLAVAGLAHLVLLALVPIGRLTLFSWHSITFLCVHRVALVLVSRLKNNRI